MTRDERTGLIVLIAFLLIAAVLLSVASNGGQAVTNILSNLVVNLDEPPAPETAVQLVPIKAEAAPYFLIAFVTISTSLVTLVAIAVYAAVRHHIPRSWSLFLLIVGLTTIPLALAEGRLQSALLTVTDSQVTHNGEWEGLRTGLGLLMTITGIEGIAALIGLALLVWSLTRGSRANASA